MASWHFLLVSYKQAHYRTHSTRKPGDRPLVVPRRHFNAFALSLFSYSLFVVIHNITQKHTDTSYASYFNTTIASTAAATTTIYTIPQLLLKLSLFSIYTYITLPSDSSLGDTYHLLFCTLFPSLSFYIL